MVLNKTNLANWDKFGFQLYKFGIVVTKLAFTNAKMQYFDKMVFKISIYQFCEQTCIHQHQNGHTGAKTSIE